MEAKKISVDEAYDSPPLWYDARGLMILWLTYRSTLRRQIEFFSKFRSEGDHLEVAIGSGSLFRFVLWAARLRGVVPKKIKGFDYAPSMLAGAKKLFSNSQNISLEVADAMQLEYPGASFDSVHIANALHCIPDYKRALAEMARVMRPGGELKINALLKPEGFLKSISERVNQWGIRKGILVAPLDAEEVLETLRALNFNIESAKREGNCLYVVAVKSSS